MQSWENINKEQLNCLEVEDKIVAGNLTTKGDQKIDKDSKKPKKRLTNSSKETLETLADALIPNTDVNEHLELLDDNIEEDKLIDDITNKRNLDNIIKQLQKNKAPGTDGLKNEIIQHAWEKIRDQMAYIFKYSLKLNHIPKAWQKK